MILTASGDPSHQQVDKTAQDANQEKHNTSQHGPIPNPGMEGITRLNLGRRILIRNAGKESVVDHSGPKQCEAASRQEKEQNQPPLPIIHSQCTSLGQEGDASGIPAWKGQNRG